MEHMTPITETNRPARVPPIVWMLGVGLVVALIAVFVFNVPLGTVGYYGLFALFIGSHFFMHGSHGTHDEPGTHNAHGGHADKGQGRHSGGGAQ